jgi:uncharacterized protein (DUF2141 family)
MKTYFAIVTAWLSVILSGQACAQSHTLKVDIRQLKATPGTVFIALLDTSQKDVQRLAIPVKDNVARVVFHNVLPGRYAVRFFIDENNNRKLDKSILGVPKESWGCSNDAKGTFGPPKFEAMLFLLTAEKTIVIHAN